MIKFIKSKRKFVFYYLVVNMILVTILFMTFSSFPTYDTAVIRRNQPYISTLNTTMEILTDGNTLVTENLTVKGVKSDTFSYKHLFLAKDEIVDEKSVKIIDSNYVLTHTYTREDRGAVLDLKIAAPLKDNEKITIQYKVSGLIKRVKEGQMFQYNPWTSQEVDVVNAYFKIVFPTDVSANIKGYNTASTSQVFEKKENRVLSTEVSSSNHRGNEYELMVWDTKAFTQNENNLGRAFFRSIDDIEADVQNQIKLIQLDDKKYIMFQYFLRIMYIVLSTIITFVFAMFLLTNFIETQSIKKYLRFEFSPSRLGPGSAAKLIQMRGNELESAIKAGTLYMAVSGFITCKKDKQGLVLTKIRDIDIDEMEEIVALQKFLFADADVVHLVKEVTDLDMTSRKTMHFFNYRKLIERVVHEQYGHRERGLHKKKSVLWHMKMEFIIIFSLLVEFALFLLLDVSTAQITVETYIGIEVIMVIIALFASGIIPLVYYFSQKRTMNEKNFDILSEWQYFRTFLFNKKLVREQLQNSDEQWQSFLMYGSIFGAEKTVLSAMKNSCPEHYQAVMQGSGKAIIDTPDGYFAYSVK